MQYVIGVENVKCGGCANTIQNALRETEGVQAVSVEVPTGTVRVETDALPRDLLVSILTALGYPEKAAG